MTSGPELPSGPATAYIICSTPRTGSTLLCRLLESTGVAGRPQSWFRAEDLGTWARRWGLPLSHGAPANFHDYVAAAIRAGRTDNNVFAARIMWGSMDALVDGLAMPGTPTQAECLTVTFGPLRFVYIHREDTVAQAVSWLRAEQSQVWHRLECAEAAPDSPSHYDFAALDTLVQTIRAHNSAWAQWFDANDVQPLRLAYEALDANPVATTQSLLDALGLVLPQGCTISAPNVRLADETSREWAQRYRSDIAARS
tara:strand:- start:4112 stop:4876 length:765 start_codon:yes stop_codon:yes gene_type:complete